DPEPAHAEGEGEGVGQLGEDKAEEDDAGREHAFAHAIAAPVAIGHGGLGPEGPCPGRGVTPILATSDSSLSFARGSLAMYPQILFPIFMLFLAVLAYGWFYWQRASTRSSTGAGAGDPQASEQPAESR